jgi:dihydropteroate synthase
VIDVRRKTAAAFLDGRAGAFYVRPVGLLSGADARAALAAGTALPLAGGPLAFSLCEIITRGPKRRRTVLASVSELAVLSAGASGPAARLSPILDALTRPRAPFAGLPLACGDAGRVVLMGIVNATPDSFSDGGRFARPEDAVAHALDMAQAGAAIIDVGGESTRPGATPVAAEEEIARIIPIVRALASRGLTVSIDTRKPAVMAAALEAGARIVNDVTALADPESASVVARTGASALLMHMQGEPATMQDNPTYDDAALDVYDFLEARVRACEAAGIPAERLAVDPGIGFGKTKVHNAEILGALSLYQGLGCGLMIGVSRKAFVGGPEGRLPPSERLPGSLAAALAAVAQGVQIVRVHDVAQTRQALAVWAAIEAAGGGEPGIS